MGRMSATDELCQKLGYAINKISFIMENVDTYRDSQKKDNILVSCNYVLETLRNIKGNFNKGQINYNPCKNCNFQICSSCQYGRDW